MRRNSMKNAVEKIIIIGSGPAGLTSAIYTARSLLNPLMIEGEEAGGQLMLTSDVENYPGFEHGINGTELMGQMRAQAKRFGTRFISKNASKVDFSVRPFKVWVGEELYLAESVIISTGAKAKLLGLESEKKYLSRGVSTCVTCDGAFYRNMDVAVIGGGDTAMEEALFLTRFAKSVTLIHRRDTFRASKIMTEKALNHPKISAIMDTEIEEVLGDGKSVTALKLKNNKNEIISELAVAGLFVAIGHQPRTELFPQLEKDSGGYLVTTPGLTKTNIPGVFAAGDVQDPIFRQAITAAGAGCKAALEVEKWLEENSREES